MKEAQLSMFERQIDGGRLHSELYFEIALSSERELLFIRITSFFRVSDVLGAVR